jgi:PAS domain S-box-containing protein
MSENAETGLDVVVAGLRSEVAELRARLAEVAPAPEKPLVEIMLRDNARRRKAEADLATATTWIELAQQHGRVAAYHFDIATGALDWSPSTYSLYDWPAEREPTLDAWLDSIHPDDRARARENAMRAVELGEAIEHDFRIVRSDGSIRWIQDRGRVVVDGEGRPLQAIGINVDITDLIEGRAAIAEREEQFRFTFQNAAVGVAHVAMDGRFLDVNACLCRILGYERDALMALTFVDITHPDDLAADLAEVAKVIDGSSQGYTLEKRYVRADGSVVWAELYVSLRRAPDGTPLHFISIVSDIQARKAAEERATLLMGEMAHRSKNLMTVLESIVHFSSRHAGNLEDFAQTLIDRIHSLAASHDLLSESALAPTGLRALAERQLSAFVAAGDGRAELSGPAVPLNSRAAQTIGLALHELGTNACKYGALSRPAGRISINWRVEDDQLELSWTERGGPPVLPPTRSGFGRRVIERLVKTSLAADVELRFDPAGLSWRVTTPLAELA